MLILARKKDESIIIGNNIELSIIDIKGDQVKLGIKAPPEIKIYRTEVFEAIQRENQEAARAANKLPDISIFENSKKAKS